MDENPYRSPKAEDKARGHRSRSVVDWIIVGVAVLTVIGLIALIVQCVVNPPFWLTGAEMN